MSSDTIPINKTDQTEETEQKLKFERREIHWNQLIFFAYVHIGAGIGIYYLITESPCKTFFWGYLCGLASAEGTGVGAHRLWTHRAFKAKLPLRILLAFFQTMGLQNSIYHFARDHRSHHKYSDTEFDPHNARKGFFYSHIGWLLLKKEDKVIQKGRSIDMSDLEADPVVMFQKKYYWYLVAVFAVLLPVTVPWYFWNERFQISWYICFTLRCFITYHGLFLVNSAAHFFGKGPYDKDILPRENLVVSLITNGEGWHNYHHTFPWDYKAAEMGSYFTNLSTAFIDLMAKVGWAYDLKSASVEMIKKRIVKTGDGSWQFKESNTWGWGDEETSMDVLTDKDYTQE